MGKKKKIKKSIESYGKRIKEHEEKLKKYGEEGGKNYTLEMYWIKETERFKRFKEEELKKLKKKKKP